jgi:two-component system, chemotaxis family, protein-glutamate methylesterase/glutaminase
VIRVLVVDDSALIRQLMRKVLDGAEGILVVGTAANPNEAREKIKALNPDVITLDVEMPGMDGLSFLKRLMNLRPTPVVMVSALTTREAEVSLKALAMGAVEVVAKPAVDFARGWPEVAREIAEKVRLAACSKVRFQKAINSASGANGVRLKSTCRVIAMGASTGGVPVLREILEAVPANTPPIVIVQHLPESFSNSFAKRLNAISAMTVRLAADGMRLIPGHAYVAPGGTHMTLVRSGEHLRVSLFRGPADAGHVPSVDVLFGSAAEAAGSEAVGMLLTGMGRDGARGLRKMRCAGATTIAQDEPSSLIFGMPKAAIELGAAGMMMNPAEIVAFLQSANS